MTHPEPQSSRGGVVRWLLSAGGGILVLALLAFGFRSQSPIEGRPAPTFELAAYDGARHALANHRGQVVVVNFWASWCEPCQQEARALEQISHEYEERDVVFLGVNAQDLERNALAFIERYGISYPNGPDRFGRIARAYGVRAFPETFFIAADGTVAVRHIGVVTETRLRQVLDGLLQ